MNQTQAIALYQPVLQQIAIKMVGSLADAEDIVQDTFLKWLSIKSEKIENTKAYLIKAVTNNCINHLNALNKKKNEYLHNLNPSELIDWYREKEFFTFDMENEISSALNVIHRKLEPLEKGIYILREFFDFEYDELHQIFDKKKDNCRQLFCRAKEKLSQETEKIKTDINNSSLVENFKKACNMGSPADLIHEVKKEMGMIDSGQLTMDS